ncbi:YdcF family protein [Saccharopolyspora shandongensis]|uniref:YdcF family protein n=1 Tax=Saccharopolyspora shandongensis TaxID=418495 RepID=UPI0033EC6B16
MHDDYQVPIALFFVPSGVFFAIFLVSFAFDRRKVRNGLYLFFALLFLGGASLMAVASKSVIVAGFVLILLVFLILLMILVLAIFLVANGVTMLRREGKRLANLLSLAAGIGIFGYIGLRMLANGTQWVPLQVFMDAVGAVISYVSLLFMCFLLYSFVYGRIRQRRAVDFIVVLGSGLIGSRVPPLLASRLDRGRAAFDAQRAKGRDPMLVTSGGQGPGEDLPEARAMADYLIDKGVPEDRILVEDQSRSTEENLRFSKTIMQQHRPKYRCVVVTNNYHVMRAATITRKEKVNGQVIGSPTARYFWPSATIREFVAVFLSHKIVNFGICAFLIITTVLPAFQDR